MKNKILFTKHLSSRLIVNIIIFVFSIWLSNSTLQASDSWLISEVAHGDTGGPSLAFDSLGQPTIVYWKGGVKLATQTGTNWQKTNVPTTGPNPRNFSLAFDHSGLPGIAYGAAWEPGDHGVHYIHFDGSSWDDETVYWGLCGTSPSLAFHPNGQPVVVGEVFSDGRYCKCLSDNYWPGIPFDSVGSTPSFKFRSNNPLIDDPAIAHVRANELDYFSNPQFNELTQSWSWDKVVVDIGSAFDFVSLSVSSLGNVGIAYRDPTNGYLKYASSSSGWVASVIDTGIDIGCYASLDFDKDGLPGIAYIDDDCSDWRIAGPLKYAHFNGQGWEITTVADYATMSSFAFSNEGNPCIAFVGSAGESNLYYATIPEPATILLLTLGGLFLKRKNNSVHPR